MSANKIFAIFIVGMLVILAGCIVVLRLPEKFEGIKPKSLSGQPSQALVVLGKESTAIKSRLTKTDKKSGDLILEQSSEFEISYLISNDQFIITIKTTPYGDVKKKAEKWFTDKGLSAGDLCLLRITFVSPKDLNVVFTPESVAPSGCAAPTSEEVLHQSTQLAP